MHEVGAHVGRAGVLHAESNCRRVPQVLENSLGERLRALVLEGGSPGFKSQVNSLVDKFLTLNLFGCLVGGVVGLTL